MPPSSAYQENCCEQWVSNLVKFWTAIIAMVHCKITTHPPFQKAKNKSTNYLFSVKTYGSNYFQLKTKAWNNYQMYDSVAQIEVEKKKVCKLSTSMSNQPPLYLLSIQIPAPFPCPGQTFRGNQSGIFHWFNSLHSTRPGALVHLKKIKRPEFSLGASWEISDV